MHGAKSCDSFSRPSRKGQLFQEVSHVKYFIEKRQEEVWSCQKMDNASKMCMELPNCRAVFATAWA